MECAVFSYLGKLIRAPHGKESSVLRVDRTESIELLDLVKQFKYFSVLIVLHDFHFLLDCTMTFHLTLQILSESDSEYFRADLSQRNVQTTTN